MAVVSANAVAVKVTVPALAAVAFTLLTSAVPPKVRKVLALPLTSVGTDTGEIEPPPPATANVTTAPCTGTLLLFFT